ncbi:uncharacterized protein RB166_003286 [Leptodactylus fuscus]
MDPGHHSAYLLAILICILLLLLAAFAILMCYLRRKGFTKSKRISSMRDQSTSMTSFAWNYMDSKVPIYNNPHTISIAVDIHKITPSLSLDSHILCISDEDEGTLGSSLDSKSGRKKSDSSGQYSAFKYMLSSGASFLGSVLEKSSLFSLKSKRRSSSLKSGIDGEVLMVPLESPVHVSSANAFQAATLPPNLSRSSTLLCEDSCDQQFTWNTACLSTQSENITQKDPSLVPSAIEKEPYNTEDKSVTKELVQVPYSDCLEPKSWFVPIGNRPVSDGAKLEKKELNNVTSLDSGVDTTELLLRPGSGGLNTMPKVLPTQGSATYIPLSSTKANSSRDDVQEEEETREDGSKLYITHQEAARKLNSGYPGRSLWERREERPLIGVN